MTDGGGEFGVRRGGVLRSPGFVSIPPIRIRLDAAPLRLLPGSVEAVFFLPLPLRVPMVRLVLDLADLVLPVLDLLHLHRRLFFFSTLRTHSSPLTHPR